MSGLSCLWLQCNGQTYQVVQPSCGVCQRILGHAEHITKLTTRCWVQAGQVIKTLNEHLELLSSKDAEVVFIPQTAQY